MPNRSRRTALVTGAAHGIGEGIARRLAREGYALSLLDINGEGCEKVASSIEKEHGVETLTLQCDTGSESEVAAALAEIGKTFGGLDALVNNAGIADPDAGPLETLSRGTWDHYLATNLTGYFLVAKYALPLLRARRGAVVNIASIHALQSDRAHNAAYAATKGGIVALTHALALELAPDIRVNCISPGWIDVRDEVDRDANPQGASEMAQQPVGRVGEPGDVAALAAWLLSDEAAFVTAQNVISDGGVTRRMIYD